MKSNIGITGSTGSLGRILIKFSMKIFVFIAVFMIAIFLIGKMDLPTPNKIIKQNIPNEKFKTLK